MKPALYSILALALPVFLISCTEDLVEVVPADFAQNVVAGDAPTAAKTHRSSSPVLTFADMSTVGSSTLNRHPNGVSMTLHTGGIPGGMAVTVWWVIFNSPENCATAPCSEPDIFDPAVRADVAYAAGHVTGRGNNVRFAGQLHAGDASGSIMPFFNALLGLDLPSLGLENPAGAEIHLVVRTHQEALPEFLPDMIQSFNGGCMYPDGVPTDFGAPGPNTCTDIQFAVFQP